MNQVLLGLWLAKPCENGSMVRSPRSGRGEVELVSGDFEAVHLFDPGRVC
jgi:hypothetical protein